MKRMKTRKNFKRTQKRNKYNKSRKTRSRTRKGGGEKEIKEQFVKNEFRRMVLNSFNKFQQAVKSGNAEKIKEAVNSFKNGLRSNRTSINTLIPVTTNTIPIDKYKYKSDTTPIIAFVPLLVIIFDNIDDTTIRKVFVKNFIDNTGNINLKSYTKDITALSAAIKLQDKELVKFLLENDADVKILTDEQESSLNELLREEEIVAIVEPTPTTPLVKLDIPTELPSESGYSLEVEPEFWKPIFEPNEMITIRNKINEMMNADGNIPITNREVTELWSVCKINETMIPTYFTQQKNEPYMVFGSMVADQDIDFSHYNIVLCAALIIFGLISKKMVGQDYKLIFKGGKAIQLVLAGMSETSKYNSDDIDLIIMPSLDIPYNETNVKNLSGHLAYLLRWFLNTQDTTYKVSVQPPNPANLRANPYIFKLSYVKVKQKRDYRKQIMVDDFRQFSDIDFKQIPDNIKAYFDKSIEYTFHIPELEEEVIFRCPNIGALLDEKIYYYAKYFEFEKMLKERKPITEKDYENITIIDCERFLEKFKRAILAMNTGLQKQRFIGIMPDELLTKERTSISTRLTKLGITDEMMKTLIVQSLYA